MSIRSCVRACVSGRVRSIRISQIYSRNPSEFASTLNARIPTEHIKFTGRRAPIGLRSRLRSASAWQTGEAAARPTRGGAHGVIALPKTALSGVFALPWVLDLIQRRWVFQSGRVAEVFAEIRGARCGASLCVSRFWYIADEQNFLGSERFARLNGERVF